MSGKLVVLSQEHQKNYINLYSSLVSTKHLVELFSKNKNVTGRIYFKKLIVKEIKLKLLKCCNETFKFISNGTIF